MASAGERLSEGERGKGGYRGVQALRAIAAVAVVAVHSTDYLLFRNGSRPPALAWFPGQAGVDIFFVISGFVMMISSGRMAGTKAAARTFLWRRLLRIAPLYWLLTAAKLAVVWIRPALSEHPPPTLWNAISSFLFIPSRQTSGSIGAVVVVGWTLSFEMVFYVIFAAALTRRANVLKTLMPAILLVAAVGSFRTDSWPAWTLVLNPIVLEFLAGAVLGALVARRALSFPVTGACLMALGFASIGLLQLGGDASFDRPLKWGLPAVAIVLGAVLLESSTASWLPQWLLLLGDASYSIYLGHGFVLPVVHFAIERAAPHLVPDHPLRAGLDLIFFSVTASCLAGVVLYRTVERPLTNYLKRIPAIRAEARPTALRSR